MAYVLGFIYADGCMYVSARGNYVLVTSTDEEIIFKIKKWLKSNHKIRISKSSWPNGKTRFVLRMGNKELYGSLKELGLRPNKSLTIGLPRIPVEFLCDFVRGYFDGDGCVHLDKMRGSKSQLIVKKLSIIFTSGSKNFLEDLLKILRVNLVLKQTKIYNSHRSYQLRFTTGDTMTLFKFLYQNSPKELFFARKFKIFYEYFKLRPQRIDKAINKILERNMA